MDNTSYVNTTERGLTKNIEISVPWGHVSGKTWGEETNEPVLCIHGWMDNCNTFDTLIPLLPKNKFYVCIDFPGCGLSSYFPPGMFYTKVDNIALIYRLMKYFKWTKFSIIGHSLGGNLAGLFSGVFPEVVDKLILLEAAALYPARAEDVGKKVYGSIVGMFKLNSRKDQTLHTYTLEGAKSRLIKANGDLTREDAAILLERGARKLDNGLYVFARDKRHRFIESCPLSFEMAEEVIRNIQAQILQIICSDGDIKVKDVKEHVEFVQDILKDNKHFKNIRVEGQHFLHLCNPELMATHISDQLNLPARNLSKL